MKTVGARHVWAVQEITAALGRRLEGIPSVWIEAEIQNLRQRGGQVYFTLRDTHQIDGSMRVVLFDRLEHRPTDGSLVYAYGRVEFWAERAQISMRIERMEPAGEGAMLAQIEATKTRLAQEGLLSDARKRTLPLVPRRIGLVTSAVGAARNDVLNNLWSRFPGGRRARRRARPGPRGAPRDRAGLGAAQRYSGDRRHHRRPRRRPARGPDGVQRRASSAVRSPRRGRPS